MSPKFFPDPVLSLASNSIGKLNTLDADSLWYMWMVFTKCAENLENGRRLENLSWRLWRRTAFFLHDTSPMLEGSDLYKGMPKFIKDKNMDVPELSVSVDSASSVDEHEIKGKVANYRVSNVPILLPAPSKKQNIVRCVSPNRFQKIITNLMPFTIEVGKGKNVDNTKILASHSYEKGVSEISKENELHSETLNDSQKGYPCSASLLSSNIDTSFSAKEESLQLNKKHPESTEIVDNTSESHVNKISCNTAKNHHIQIQASFEKPDKMFFIQETLPVESFIKDISKKEFKLNNSKRTYNQPVKSGKHISFQKLTLASSEFSKNDPSDCNSSNSDNNDWDSVYDSSDPSSVSEKPAFQKINTSLSQPQLQSHKSLLSSMLQNKSGKTLANLGSKSSPAIALSQTSVSSIIPKQITYNQHPIANQVSNISPNVTSSQMIRKNMFATELSESLRRNLLWERQQRSTTVFDASKYHNTVYETAKVNKLSVQTHKQNYDFFDDVDYGYHAAGW
ncbi:hypothetical protein PMAC_000589 [Pneumocystis sp. 'macacae']|nr:hypothetical protein PMAC_000589 [Pneumocystis sp. 'macacae']